MPSMSRRKFVVHSAHASIGVSLASLVAPSAWADPALPTAADDRAVSADEASSVTASAKPGAKQPPAAAARPVELCLVSGSLEYKSDESLSALEEYLHKHYSVRCRRVFMRNEEDLPGLEQLEAADCMVLFTRRLRLPAAQVDRVKAYCRRGGAIVGLRTASHAFQNWLALDNEVFGGDYGGHYGDKDKPQIELAPSAKGHPVLRGVMPYVSSGSLYKNPKIAADTTLLLTGTIPGRREPVAWTRHHRGGRVFYTSLGHPDDFRHASFLNLVVNAVFWATRRPTAERLP